MCGLFFLILPFSLNSASVATKGWLLLIFLTGLVFTSSYLLARLFFRARGATELVITASTLFLSQIVITLTILGAISRLRLGYVAFAQALILLTILILLRRKLILRAGMEPRPYSRGESPGSPVLRPDYLLFYIVTLAAMLIYLSILISLALPPYSWGSLNYHLTFPAEWLGSGRIKIVPFSFGTTDSYAPSDVELFYLWLILPLKSDLLAKVGQFPFYLLGALVIYGICRELGIGRRAGTFGGLLFLLTPDIFRQAATAEVDVAVASFFLLTIYFLLLSLRKKETKHLLLAGLAMGLFLGSKYLSVGYAPILVPLFLYVLFKQGRLVRALVGGGLFFLGTFLSGSYWYLRNLILTGSALYPLTVKFFGITLMRGAYGLETMKADSPFRAGAAASLLDIVAKAFGTPFFFLFLITLPIALILILFRPARPGEERARLLKAYILALPLLLIAVFCWVIPYTKEYRFLFPAVGLSYVGAALVIGRARRSRLAWRMLLFLLVLSCAFIAGGVFERLPGHLPSLVSPRHGLTLLAGSILLFVIIFLIPKSEIFSKKVGLLGCFVGLIFLLFFFHLYFFPELIFPPAEKAVASSRWGNLSTGLFSRAYGQETSLLPINLNLVNYGPFNLAWDWLLSNTSATIIAYTGHNIPYFLYGRRFQNKVYYVNINAHPGWLFHQYDRAARESPDYKPPVDKKPGYNRANPDYSAWLSNLRHRGVKILFIYQVQEEGRKYFSQADKNFFPLENTWARANPEIFKEVYANLWTMVYELRPVGDTIK